MKEKIKLILYVLGTATLMIGFLSSTGDSQTNWQRRMPVKKRPSVMQKMPTAKTAPRANARKVIAPWQQITPKQKKTLQKFVGPGLYRKLNQPIQDVKYKRFVSKRGRAFRSGNKVIPLVMDTNAIIDLGARTMDRSNTMSLIDLKKSTALNAMIKDELRLGGSKSSFITAFLKISFALDYEGSLQSKQEKYRYKEKLFVGSYDSESKRTALWMLEDGKWINQYDTCQDPGVDQRQRQVFPKMEIAKGKTYYQGFKRVNVEGQGAERKKVFGKRIVGQAALPQMQCNNSGCMEARPLATQNKSIRFNKRIFDEIVCDQYGCRHRSESDSSQQGFSGGQDPVPPPSGDSGTSEQGPPPRMGYVAYGDPDYFSTWAGCNRKCSQGDCTGCCSTQFLIEHAHIVAGQTACHLASGFWCPWCHAFCVGAAVAAHTTSATINLMCTTNCSRNYEEEGPNPNQCSIVEL